MRGPVEQEGIGIKNKQERFCRSPRRTWCRLGRFNGRRLAATVIGSLWLLLAAAAHVGGAVFLRAATAVMQPLTADHQMVALQATTITYLFSVPLYGALLIAGRRRLNESSLRDARPRTEKRDGRLACLLRLVRWIPPVHWLLFRLVELEKRHRWVLTLLPFQLAYVSSNLLAQFYAARLPFVSGNAITTFGPITMAMVIAWKGDRKGLPFFLPLMSAAGAAMMIPWGQHIDGVGVLAALGGAVTSALMVSSGKEMAHAGISLKGTGLSMLVGLLLGVPFLFVLNWTEEVLVRGVVAGLLAVGGAVLYWLANAPLHLPKRLSGALTANGPALSGLVGIFVLGQSIALLGLLGIGAILAASLLNAGLTGSADEEAEEKAKYTTRAEEPGADGRASQMPDRSTRTKPRHANKRPPSWQAHTRKRKARTRGRRQHKRP